MNQEMIRKALGLFKMNKVRLIHKINTLENEKITLEETIKSELYKVFINKLQESQEIQKLKETNKMLRKKNKTLRALLIGDDNAKTI